MAVQKAGPVVSDNGNFVIDAPFSQEILKEPYEVSFDSTMYLQVTSIQLLKRIKMFTGVVEVGLFCGMAKAAYFGNEVRFTLISHTIDI
jgi:ribose 5-phosphate isomerase A